MKKLRKKFKETLDARNKQIEEYRKLILEEVEIDLHQVLLSDVPGATTTKQLEAIMPFIKEK